MESIHPLNHYVKTVIVVLLFEESPPGWALTKAPSRAAPRKACNYVAEPNTFRRQRWSAGTWHRKRLAFIFQYPGPIPTNSISSAKNRTTLYPLPETTVDTRRGPPPGAKFVGLGTKEASPAGANQVRGHLCKLETNPPIWVGYWLQVAQAHSLTNLWALGSRV